MKLQRVQQRGEDRRRLILETAIKLFGEKGYDRTSIPDIIKASGGSNSMIYQTFGGKQGLFRAAVSHLIEQTFESTSVTAEQAPSLHDELYLYGHALLTAFLEDGAFGLQRLVAGEAGRYPELGDVFYHLGVEQSYLHVEGILKRHTSLPDTKVARLAAYFVESLKFGCYRRKLLLNTEPASGEIDADVSLAVDALIGFVDKQKVAPVMGSLFDPHEL